MYVSPVAWLTTSAAVTEPSSTTASEVAKYGMPRLALVLPSMGSTTTTASRRPRSKPLSSLMMLTPARRSVDSAASSATRSSAYCPDRWPDGPKSVTPRIAAATASAVSCSSGNHPS
ncbi:MAG: hypothetical protein V9E89_10895 [Ilumatobacteraceae bacterium]